jgi:hypothetical protein
MMKNILNIDIYLHERMDTTSYSEKIAALDKRSALFNIFQKVQTSSLVFSEGTR